MFDPFLIAGLQGTKEITSQQILAPASFSKTQLTNRDSHFGLDTNVYHEPIANNITIQDMTRRPLPTKKDYIVTVGNRIKEEQIVKPSYEGVARNTSSDFPRPPNDGALLIPTDSMYADRLNRLGIVA